jgi:hypothetical protein
MRKILCALLLFALCAMAGDVSGKWTGTLTPDGDEAKPAYLVFKQDGDKLTGSGGPDESEQHAIQNGKVDGDHLTFEIVAGKGTMSFDLKVAGDEIKGGIQLKGDNEVKTAKVALKRAA